MNKLLVLTAIFAFAAVAYGQVYNCNANLWHWYDVKQNADYSFTFSQPTNPLKIAQMDQWCRDNCFRSGAQHPACSLNVAPSASSNWWIKCFCWGNGLCANNGACPPGTFCELDMDTGYVCTPNP